MRLGGAIAILLISAAAAAPQKQPLTFTSDERHFFEGSDTAPDFPSNIEWLNTASSLNLRQFRGKLVLLDFWTYCCINCMHAVPDLQRLERKYARELVVLGIHSAKFANEKQTGQIREAILRYGVSHPVANDDNLEIWRRYNIQGWPTFVLINPEGRIMGMYADERVYSLLDPVLARAVAYFTQKGKLRQDPITWPLEQSKISDTLLSFPGKISADDVHKRLVISDSGHNRILVTDNAGKLLHVIGSGSAGSNDGPFDRAQFRNPQGTSATGDLIYVADTGNHKIRVANLASGQVTTLLGSGEQSRGPVIAGRGAAAVLNSPWDVLAHNGQLYIAMAGSHQLCAANLATADLRVLAGSGTEGLADGAPLKSALAQPSALATDGEAVYFADSESSSIRKLGLEQGAKVTTLIGKGLFEFGDVDGERGKVRLQHPLGLAFHDRILYVADTYNHKIKTLDPETRTVRTIQANVKFNEPGGLAWLDGRLYIADTNQDAIRILDPVSGTMSSLEIRGLDALVTRQMSRFTGRIVDAGELRISRRSLDVSLDIQLPPRYKLNPDAPFFLQWERLDGGEPSSPQKVEEVDRAAPRFPANIHLGGVSEAALIGIETVVYYCIDTNTTCYVDPVQVRVKLVPADGADMTPLLKLAVKDPGSHGRE
jgi:thiol-disulfide isomerase/thioredoxin